MRGSSDDIGDYLARVAMLLERNGVVLRLTEGADLELDEHDVTGDLSFELLGDLPDARTASRSELVVRERFARLGPDDYVRAAYAYELRDRAREFRRAFHLHDPEWFQREFLVVVHEHCESPIGHELCGHYEGSPIKDAYAGVMTLMDVWSADPPDCSRLRCLR
jgi:hypothetical protein